jgi:proteic killer suppression protein
MIESFRHKGLRQLFEDDDPKGLNAEHVRKIRQILALLDAAQDRISELCGPSAASVEGRLERLLVADRARKVADYFSLRGRQGVRC